MSGNKAIILPLSSAQYEIWIAEQKLDTGNRVYRVGEYVEIYGSVDPVLFEVALRRVVGEVDALHVRFVEYGDGPRQIVEVFTDWAMPVVDVSDESDPRAAALAWITTDVSQSMDLTRGQLFSYALIKLATDRFWWYQGYHHIVMDGFGCALVAQRLAEVYTALVHERPCNEKVFGSLRQLLDSDASYRTSEQFVQDRAYWLDRFVDHPEPTRLAGRSSRTPKSLIHQTAYLSLAQVDRLWTGVRQARVPWPLIVMAATTIYIHRFTGVTDVVVGLAVTARQGPILRRSPGMVSNVLPLRLLICPSMTLLEFIRSVQHEVHEILKRQRYRGDDLYRDLGLPGGGAGAQFEPVINVISFDYDLRFAGHRGATHNISFGLIDDLSITIWDRKDASEFRLDWQAHPEVCNQNELAAHQRRFLALLDAIAVTDPDQPIGCIDILSVQRPTSVMGTVPQLAAATELTGRFVPLS